MKIVYCIHGTFNSGGMEKIITEKANYLSGNGNDVYIVTTEQKNRKSFFKINDNIKCYDLDINYEDENNTSIIKKMSSFIVKQHIHKKRLTQLLKKIKADIVISTFGNEVNFLYQINDGSKKILEIHFSKFFRIQLQRRGIWYLVDKYRSFIDNRKAGKYDRFVVLTNEDKEYWKGIENITVIPNFISIPEETSNLTNKRAIAVGRLSFQKGYERMIKAWAIVNKRHPEWKLDIFGNGEDKDHINGMITELHLDNSVTIHPPTTAIGNEYKESSLFLLSSRYEGLPMVLLEAISYGLAIVTYDCKCGPKDIISGDNGILVKEGDIGSFANNIIKLIENPDKMRSIAQKARKDAYDYSKDAVMNKWMNLFNEIKPASR